MATETNGLSFYYKGHSHEHTLVSEVNKSKLSDQSLYKESETGYDRSPLHNLKTLGTMF